MKPWNPVTSWYCWWQPEIRLTAPVWGNGSWYPMICSVFFTSKRWYQQYGKSLGSNPRQPVWTELNASTNFVTKKCNTSIQRLKEMVQKHGGPVVTLEIFQTQLPSCICWWKKMTRSILMENIRTPSNIPLIGTLQGTNIPPKGKRKIIDSKVPWDGILEV